MKVSNDFCAFQTGLAPSPRKVGLGVREIENLSGFKSLQTSALKEPRIDSISQEEAKNARSLLLSANGLAGAEQFLVRPRLQTGGEGSKGLACVGLEVVASLDMPLPN